MRTEARCALMILAVLVLVGTIVFAPLDKLCAKLLAVVPIHSEPIAPFNKVGVTKDIFIVGATPNKKQWLRTNRIEPKFNEDSGRSTHINEFSSFDALRGNEQRLRWIRIFIEKFTIGWTPMYAGNYLWRCCISAISPLWLNGKTTDTQFSFAFIPIGQFLMGDVEVLGSAQLSIEPANENIGAFGRFESLFSSFPKILGGSPKSEGEDRYRNCRKGVDVVSICMIPDKSQESEDRLMQGGASLIAGIDFSIIFIAY